MHSKAKTSFLSQILSLQLTPYLLTMILMLFQIEGTLVPWDEINDTNIRWVAFELAHVVTIMID